MNLSIRLFGKILALTLLIIFFVFIYFINTLHQTVEAKRAFRNNSYQRILKADELRRSSNFLTRFAKDYVITGDKQYKENYFRVLNIRNAKEYKPKNYQNIYWSLTEPTRSQRHPITKNKVSLIQELKTLKFTKEQLSLLNLSLNNSNELVNLELRAFNAMKDNNQKLAIKILYSTEYIEAKNSIMLPIDTFIESLYEEHSKNLNILAQKIDSLFSLIFILVISGISVFFISLFVLRKKVLIPIEYLSSIIEKFNHGDKNFKKIIHCDDEIGLFTKQFFEMKDQLDVDFDKLRKLSITDPLTGIKNRRAFFEVSENFFKLANRKDLPLSLLILDIDLFKKVNDTYGHIIGDEILKFLVKQTNQTLRDSDIFARYGGEEFIILLPDTDLNGAIQVAEKIRKAIESTPYQGDVEVSITVSLGVAQLQNEKILNKLIQRADEALYRAKEYGRNRVEAS